MKNNLQLVRGEWNALTGNAVVYWDIEGEQSIVPDAKVIAANFIISSLMLDDKILTATFPPVPYRSYEELDESLSNVACDIIYAGELTLPDEEEDFKKFYKSEIVRYNRIIQTYTMKYKDRMIFKPDRLSEKEQLDLLSQWARQVREQIQTGKTSIKVKDDWGKMQNLIEVIAKRYKKYDIDNLARILFLPGQRIDSLTNLYIQKFLAIFQENYEIAKDLNGEIENLEAITPDDYQTFLKNATVFNEKSKQLKSKNE